MKKWKLKSSILILNLGFLTVLPTSVSSAAANRFAGANPDRLVSRKVGRVRCELLFSNYYNFIINRQRVLLTPLKSSSYENQYQIWDRQLQKHFGDLDLTYADFDQISEKMSQMTPSEKELLLKDVKELYLPVSSIKYKAVKFKEFKRTLDLILSRFDNTQEFFQSRIDEGKKPWEIYKEYFKRARELTGQGQDYPPEKIWDLLFWLQRQLKSQSEVNKTLYSEELVVYGSYVAGRAIPLKSDIDLIVSSSKGESFIDQLNEASYMKSFNVDHMGSNPLGKFSMLTASQLSPVLFVVNRHNILMKVYPHYRYAEIEGKGDPAKPLIYVLD